jgi:hypothetical protein
MKPEPLIVISFGAAASKHLISEGVDVSLISNLK